MAPDDLDWLMDNCMEGKPDIANPNVAGLQAFRSHEKMAQSYGSS